MASHFLQLPKSELYKLIDENDGVLTLTLAFNKADKYLLKNESIVLIPFQGNVGIWIESEKYFTDFLQHQKFPIQENTVNPFLANRQRLRDIDKNIHSFIFILQEELKTKMPETVTKEYLELVSNRIAEYGTKKLVKSFFLELGLFIGELFRKLEGGAWGTETVYTMNPYYIPIIEKKSSTSDYIKKIRVFDELDFHLKHNKEIKVGKLISEISDMGNIEPVYFA